MIHLIVPVFLKLILPIESVYATIKIKSTLDYDTLKQSVENIECVRKLQKLGNRNIISNEYNDQYPLGFVFAYSSKYELEQIQKRLYELNKNVNGRQQISIICVLDKGLIFNVHKKISIPNDAIYREGNMKMEYGDVRKMLNLNKKYPNLFNGKMTYDAMHKYLKEDFILMTEIQANFANVSTHQSIEIYGYKFNSESFELFKKYANGYDVNEDSKRKFDRTVEQIYQLYLKQVIERNSNK